MAWEWIVFVGAAAAMCAGCLVPNRWLPSPLPNDKLMHFGGFALLSALVLRMVQGRAEAALALAGLMLAGALIECLQAFVPERKFCWRDMAANGAGIVFVALCAQLYAVLA